MLLCQINFSRISVVFIRRITSNIQLFGLRGCTSTKMDNGKMQDETKKNLDVGMKNEDSTSQKVVQPSQDELPSEKKPLNPVKNKESEIGITEYLGDHTGFFGIIKQRYSDFIVNEVTSSGEIVHLTDRNVPPPPQIAVDVPDKLPTALSPDVLQELDDLVGIPRPARIPVIQPPMKVGADVMDTESSREGQNITLPKKDPNEVLINVNDLSKEERTNIHHAVKSKYDSVVSYFKELDDGNKYIIVQKKKAAGGGAPKRSSWPKSLMYTTFVMYKENIDTMDAISHLARRTGLKPNMFAYAGTKDRRGKTCQLVSVPRVAPERLRIAADHRPIHLGNFRFLPTPQKLGQLRGNRFHIVLREVRGEDDVIMASVESLKNKGFINYFGTQRFGTSSVSTHTIGRELLKCNWKKAIDMILCPKENDNFIVNKCCSAWKETGNAEDALRVLQGRKESSIEGRLLSGLKDAGKNDFVGALSSIPRNSRLLYLHAYQSYIWNKVVSRRVDKYGLTVLPGDIVRLKNSKAKIEEAIEDDDVEDEDDSNANDSERPKSGTDLSNFHFLTEEEAKTTPITDVLLPLPGYKIEYPHNEVKDWYIELLEADGLSVNDLKNSIKSYSVTGSYRHLIIQPSDIDIAITYYEDPTKPLIPSDLDDSKSVQENLLKEGKNKAVLIDMTLPASSYATIAFRELLKMDTSSAFQATLNTTCQSSNSKAESKKDFDEGTYFRYENNSDRKVNENKQNSKPKFHYGQKNHKYHAQGRGEKRPWRGSHGKGWKKGKFSGKHSDS